MWRTLPDVDDDDANCDGEGQFQKLMLEFDDMTYICQMYIIIRVNCEQIKFRLEEIAKANKKMGDHRLSQCTPCASVSNQMKEVNQSLDLPTLTKG